MRRCLHIACIIILIAAWAVSFLYLYHQPIPENTEIKVSDTASKNQQSIKKLKGLLISAQFHQAARNYKGEHEKLERFIKLASDLGKKELVILTRAYQAKSKPIKMPVSRKDWINRLLC